MKPCCDLMKLALKRKILIEERGAPLRVTNAYEIELKVLHPVKGHVIFKSGDDLLSCPYCWKEVPRHIPDNNAETKTD